METLCKVRVSVKRTSLLVGEETRRYIKSTDQAGLKRKAGRWRDHLTPRLCFPLSDLSRRHGPSSFKLASSFLPGTREKTTINPFSLAKYTTLRDTVTSSGWCGCQTSHLNVLPSCGQGGIFHAHPGVHSSFVDYPRNMPVLFVYARRPPLRFFKFGEAA